MANGGYRPGSGRKSKAEELKLAEKLTPFEPKALEALRKGVEKGDFQFIKLYFEYQFGKPTETIDLEHSGQIASIPLDPSKMSDDTIRALLNARGGKNP